MQLEVRSLLWDIQNACELIAQFTTDRNLGDYLTDVMFRSAVERQFGICGEAMNQLLKLDVSVGESITDPAHLIAFRNRLIHGYGLIRDEVVWGAVQTDLPLLLAEVRALLATPED